MGIMSNADKVRALGKRLDNVHTTLIETHCVLVKKLEVLNGILADEVLDPLKSELSDFNGANDEVEDIYGELGELADSMDES